MRVTTAKTKAAFYALLLLGTWTALAQPTFILGRGEESLSITTNGALSCWGQNPVRLASSASAAGEICYGTNVLGLAHPSAVVQDSGGIAFTYRWASAPGLELSIHHSLNHQGAAHLWIRILEIRSDSKLASDLILSLRSGLEPLPADTWLPLLNGTGGKLATNRSVSYRFAGGLPGPAGEALALPMISVPAHAQHLSRDSQRWLLATDPYFSVRFTPAALEWTYPVQVGLENRCERRTIVVGRHNGTPDDTINLFFQAVLPEVPPGPQWLHDIALVDYDYLSDGGQGWFHDLDAFTAAVPQRDRHQVLVCLHGWYDFLGRYCFDAQTGKLDRNWTSFSSYELAKNKPAFGTIGGERVPVGFGNCRPVAMSLTQVHERLRYARSRGFRVAMYFADGVNAGEGLPDFEPSRVLRWGGWQGPDSKGRSYFQNPLHPKVRAFFLDYTRALLAEFGSEIDALNWDETFHIPPGELGSDVFPGYADRAMMRLVRDVSRMVEDYNHQHHRQIAFLTSDCLGAFGQELKAPYALMAHGTYQDSWCQPQAWSYGIFANYRNVLWSCCWWPITKWAWVDFGVHHYQAPVSLSNGWGNDTGFSEMTAEQRERALELFKWRKKFKTHLQWLEQLPRF